MRLLKKLSRNALAICCVFAVVVNTSAEPWSESTTSRRKSVWEFGLETFDITYKEPGVMKEEGKMSGIFGSYTYYHEVAGSGNNLMLRIDGRYSSGLVDYKGSKQDGTPLTINNVNDFMWEFRVLGGDDIGRSKTSLITLYSGLGYRYLNDDLSKHVSRYERESNYIYSPIGIEIIADSEKEGSIGITLEYDYLWMGKQISRFSDIDPKHYNDIANDQDKGVGYRGSLKLSAEDFVLGIFIRYWKIKESDRQIVGYDNGKPEYRRAPKNQTTEIGFIIALQF